MNLDETLDRAYRLAYFILPHEEVATDVVTAAMLKLDVAMTAQAKRLYYTPTGRLVHDQDRSADRRGGRAGRSVGTRSKASLGELQLLQRLIYIESEPYERRNERLLGAASDDCDASTRPPDADDLLVYFIKHLVRITIKRNSFYVALGLSRLLHGYSTPETMEIYNAVIGEPERVKDDYYYRSRKSVLMQEIGERFGSLLSVCRTRRGEERFESRHDSSRFERLVTECLELFTPWDTSCHVPADFEPLRAVIARLCFRGGKEEDKVEVERMHAVLHPNCFRRLLAGLRYAPPADRLEVPRFHVAGDEETRRPSPPRRPSLGLGAGDLARIKGRLTEESQRRRASVPLMLRISVDGAERARLPAERAARINFGIRRDSELIEIHTAQPDGDLLLATHLMTDADARPGASDAERAASLFQIVLEGGQRLRLRITRDAGGADASSDLILECEYAPAASRGAEMFSNFRASVGAFFNRETADLRTPSLFIKPALACSLLIAAAAIYSLYVRQRFGAQELTANRGEATRGEARRSEDDFAPLAQRGREETEAAEKRRADAGTTAAPRPNAGRILAGTSNDRVRRRGLTTNVHPSASDHARSDARRPPHTNHDRGTKRDGAVTSSSDFRRYEGGEEAPSDVARVATVDDTDAMPTLPEATRGGGDGDIEAVPLSRVTRVHIEFVGDALGWRQCQDLSSELEFSPGLSVEANRDEADAVLRFAERSGDARGRGAALTARLINERGDVLWQAERRRSLGSTPEARREACVSIARELRRAIETERAGR